jgi:hypothetical protein
MLRLTVTVVQMMSDARVFVALHEEDPYGEPREIGSVAETYDMAWRLEEWDEVTSLVDVVRCWAESVNVDK